MKKKTREDTTSLYTESGRSFHNHKPVRRCVPTSMNTGDLFRAERSAFSQNSKFTRPRHGGAARTAIFQKKFSTPSASTISRGETHRIPSSRVLAAYANNVRAHSLPNCIFCMYGAGSLSLTFFGREAYVYVTTMTKRNTPFRTARTR